MNTIKKAIHLYLKLLLISFLIFCFYSCKNDQLPLIQASTSSDLKEIRLGESNYYLMLPGNFELLEEARGIEGQLGYNIIPKDSSSTAFGFIEIQHGRPIGDNSRLDKSAKLFAKSYLSDKKVNWTIYKTETGYFIAFTTEDGDINANVSSKKRTEIDSLISIIATLKER